MITDLEIHRAANTLIKRCGVNAEFEAAKQADAMIERGDPEGLAVAGTSLPPSRCSHCQQ